MQETKMTTLADFDARTISGQEKQLQDYLGDVVLVVNTASKCGFTPQYEGLQNLYEKYRDRGFVILGFPSNDFANQDPGTNDEIASFCQANYGVTFPMFEKVHVNGAEAAPLFQWLTDEQTGVFGKRIKWNFTKFLIGRDGRVIERFAPKTTPQDLESSVAEALEAD
jgi:glutathione peroxidase